MLVIATVLALVAGGRWSRLAWRTRRTAPDEVRFLAAVVAALRAGHTIRAAVGAAAGDEPGLGLAARAAMAGAPMSHVAEALDVLPTNGRRIGAALRVLEVTGGRAGAVFERLLERAATEADLARQKSALTAQARAAAVVVGVLPLVMLAATRGAPLASLAQVGASGAGIAAVALGMQVLGLLAVWKMAR